MKRRMRVSRRRTMTTFSAQMTREINQVLNPELNLAERSRTEELT
jgi:hypothetical protein